ncbi:MAG: type II and III secretion system protein [Bacteriovoracaceae bacterium]|jgi:pilus assembly protein CpaC|nr:type II and III secretion system protein [Bacteriovoracaceae bacterium]
MIKTFLIFLLILSFSSFSQEDKKEENLEVAIGIDVLRKLEYKYSTKIQVGNKSILKLVLSPAKQEIVFRGVKKGKTSVTVRDTAGEIRNIYIVTVTSDGSSNVVRELRELIGDIEGIEIGIKGGKVVVEGKLVVPKDIGRINIVLANYPDVLRLIELSSQAQRIIARKMQEEINKNNMPDVTVRIVNGDYWLEGVVNGEGKKNLAQSIANQYVPDKIVSLAEQSGGGDGFQGVNRGNDPVRNFITVNEQQDPPPPAKLIKVTAQFVELSKNYQKVFGISWTPALSSGGQISFGQNGNGEIGTQQSDTLAGTISNLFPKLSAGKSAGYARILQSGMIITKDGQNASINKTRDIPFAVGSGDFTSAASAKITFTLTIQPKIGANETVDMDNTQINVSLPGESTGDGNPTSITNSIRTSISAKSKESVVIGGVVQSNSSTDYDKNRPGGSATASASTEEAAPLFDLLRSKSYVTSKSQFVVFITPEILESASATTEKIRKKFRKRQR